MHRLAENLQISCLGGIPTTYGCSAEARRRPSNCSGCHSCVGGGASSSAAHPSRFSLSSSSSRAPWLYAAWGRDADGRLSLSCDDMISSLKSLQTGAGAADRLSFRRPFMPLAGDGHPAGHASKTRLQNLRIAASLAVTRPRGMPNCRAISRLVSRRQRKTATMPHSSPNEPVSQATRSSDEARLSGFRDRVASESASMARCRRVSRFWVLSRSTTCPWACRRNAPNNRRADSASCNWTVSCKTATIRAVKASWQTSQQARLPASSWRTAGVSPPVFPRVAPLPSKEPVG